MGTLGKLALKRLDWTRRSGIGARFAC